MSWPTPQDYNEAMQSPAVSFKDQELQQSAPELNALGLPRPNSGAFASVYRVYNGSTSHAVRCFLRNIADQEDRYHELTHFICNDSFECTVPFVFLKEGIRVHADWFPILKMDWVEGVTLENFVRDNLSECDVILGLAETLLQMHLELRAQDVAHGDLQHGNIMVTNDGIRLVDYDGMYIPSLAGRLSNEVGHPNYQHPTRDKNAFGPYLDNFSAWVIYTSLFALSVDPGLAARLGGLDDCLLFRASDYRDPEGSNAFHILERHQSEKVCTLTRNIRNNLRLALNDIPPATNKPEQPADLPDLPVFVRVRERPPGSNLRGGSQTNGGNAAQPHAWYAEPQNASVLTATEDAVRLVVDPDPQHLPSYHPQVGSPAPVAQAGPTSAAGAGWTEEMIVDYCAKIDRNRQLMAFLFAMTVLCVMAFIAVLFLAPPFSFILMYAAVLCWAEASRLRQMNTEATAAQIADTLIHDTPVDTTFKFDVKMLEKKNVTYGGVVYCSDSRYYQWNNRNEWVLADQEGFNRRHAQYIGYEKEVKAWFSPVDNRPIAMILDGELEWFL